MLRCTSATRVASGTGIMDDYACTICRDTGRRNTGEFCECPRGSWEEEKNELKLQEDAGVLDRGQEAGNEKDHEDEYSEDLYGDAKTSGSSRNDLHEDMSVEKKEDASAEETNDEKHSDTSSTQEGTSEDFEFGGDVCGTCGCPVGVYEDYGYSCNCDLEDYHEF